MLTTHIVLYMLDIFALVFLFGLLHGYNLLGNQRKSPFSYGVILIIIVIISEVGTVLVCNGDVELRSLSITFNVIGFALTPVIPLVLMAIFDIRILLRNKILLLPTTINTLAVTLSPFLGLIFFVDANNNYERGVIFNLFVGVYIFNIIILAVGIWYIGRKYLYPIKYKIAILTFFTVAATFIQLLVPSVYTSWHCVTLSLLLLYIVLSDFDSSFDTLTKLYNRAAFEKRTKQLNGKKSFYIIVMDINNFKDVNDTHGHEYGDTVLKELGIIISDSFNNKCSSYRIGGDEFCVLCWGDNEEMIKDQLKSMTDKLTSKREADSWMPTVAYGYSIFSQGEKLNFEKIMKEADEQMYHYKHLERESKP